MIADHTEEIQKMRAQIARLLAEKPPRRQRAKEIGQKLNVLVCLQLRRENKIARRLIERRAS